MNEFTEVKWSTIG